MRKKIILLILILTLLPLYVYGDNGMEVYLNGLRLNIQNSFNERGVVYIPAKEFFKYVGKNVIWDSINKEVYVTDGSETLILKMVVKLLDIMVESGIVKIQLKL